MSEEVRRLDHYVQPTGPRCPRCLSPTWYSTHELGYDAVFCFVCDEWAEPACEDPSCQFCRGRPARPSELVGELDFSERLLPQ